MRFFLFFLALFPCVHGTFNCYHGTLNSYEVTDEDIESGDFAACFDELGRSSLTSMTISGSLTSIPSSLLWGMDNLSYFRLIRCPNLAVIEEGVFEDLESLDDINLTRDCNCPDLILTPGVLENAVVTDLDLANYGPTILEDTILDVYLGLTVLSLNNNSLDSLPEDAFNKVPNIERISFMDNDFERVPVEVLDDVPLLTDVYFEGNPIPCWPYSSYEIHADTCVSMCTEDGEPECVDFATENHPCFGILPLCDSEGYSFEDDSEEDVVFEDSAESEDSKEGDSLCDQIDCSGADRVEASLVVTLVIGVWNLYVMS